VTTFTTIISTDALASHLDDGWVIADCRYDLQRDDWGRNEHLGAHIPGAQYVSVSHDLSGPLTGANGRHPLPSREQMTAMFSRLGIGARTQVVAYDQDSGMFASRLWWMLRYAGHDAVAVLDGGWAKWLKERRPTAGGNEQRRPARFEPSWRDEWYVDVARATALSQDRGTLLLDARAAERFEGQVEPLDRLPGHIPGAANYPYRNNLAPDNTLLPPDRLREQLTHALGGHDPEATVMYCGSGVTACQNLLAMEHAGLPGARLYVGSWSEWSADPCRPIETGPAKPRST
jgi:thiosulfate/3-mercaptopyruvate sulfurtransferase